MDIYKEVRLKCFEMSACDLSEIFREKGTKTNGAEKSKHEAHNESLGYSDKTLRKVCGLANSKFALHKMNQFMGLKSTRNTTSFFTFL